MKDHELKRVVSHMKNAEMWCPNCDKVIGEHSCRRLKLKSYTPDVGWKWGKWTFGFWTDSLNFTFFGIDIGPLEIVWRYIGYRP